MPNLSCAERAKIYAATMAILELTGDPTTREEAKRAGWAAAISLFDIFEIGALMAIARGIEDLIDDRAEIGCVAYISDRNLTRAICRCSIRASTAAMLAGLVPVDTAMSGRIWIEPGAGARQAVDLENFRWDGRHFMERNASRTSKSPSSKAHRMAKSA